MQHRLLDLVGEVYALLDLDAFRPGILDASRRAVQSDWASLNDIGPAPGAAHSLVDPPLPVELHVAFAEYARENHLLQHFLDTRDGRAHRMSDVCTQAAFHATDLYREVYAKIGLEYQMSFVFPAQEDHVLAVVLSRRQHDFSDEEVELVEAARPNLIQALRNAREHSALRQRLGEGSPVPLRDLRAYGLTSREAQVLRHVATGGSNADIARELSLSARTVQKHLENAYRKLGVKTRSEAARIAWATYAD